MSVQQILNIGELPKRVKDVQESGSICRKVAEDNRNRSAHDLRHEVGGKLQTLDFLGEAQQSDVELIVGEAVTNACCNTPDRRPIKIAWENSPSDLHLSITNSNYNCVDRKVALPEDCLSEHGRGLVIIEELVNHLSETGLRTGCSLRNCSNRTVFRISVGS
ncbi:MAG: ATP-binding protein [Patescibacteria group bacterium]|nr:ATP-binding protein [Patescibacteria group bacterium]